MAIRFRSVAESGGESDAFVGIAFHQRPDPGHGPHSVIIDGSETRVVGRMVSLLLWFDNEWAFANRMLDVSGRWLA
jgi:glyceraldehyde-3-phosphate dehydrogenase/erythrose-4-phosphate dehydrogenase